MGTPFVEAYLGGQWQNLTDAGDVLVRDRLSIRRGLADESARVSRSSASFSLRNTLGKYSARNPLSPYFGQLGRNTPLRIGDDRLLDTFARTVVDGWGTTSDGQGVWSLSGTASAFDVTASVGTIVSSASKRIATTSTYGDVETLVKMSTSALDAGLEFGLVARYQDANNYYAIVVDLTGTDTLSIVKYVGVSVAGLASVTIPTIVAGTAYWLRMQVTGQRIRGRLWQDGTAEPTTWTIDDWDDNPFNLGRPSRVGAVGCVAAFGAGATVSFDSFEAVSWRGHFEVPAWPPEWDVSGNDVWVPLNASGILRRLEQNGDAFRSPIYREATSSVNQPLTVGYWPCEDKSDATRLASGLPQGPPMRIIGSASLGSVDTIPGSDPLIRLTAAALVGDIAPHTNTGTIAWRGIFDVPSGGFADGTLICDIFCRPGGVARWALRYGTGGTLRLQAFDSANTLLGDSGIIGFAINGLRQMIGFTVEQDGADVNFAIFTRHIASGDVVVEGGFDDTLTSLTISGAARLVIGNRVQLLDCGVGHQMVGTSTALASTLDRAIVGYRGETAVARMARLCLEEGVSFFATSFTGSDTAACGVQRSGVGLVALLQDAATVDAGILYEPRNEFGLAYRTRASMYNQDPTLALDYASKEVAPPLKPVDDDQHIANDVTATRIGGSSFRAVRESGPLNVNNPADDPDAVGRYVKPLPVNADTDGQLPSIAGWGRHKGTWDEARFPLINVNQARLLQDGKTTLAAAAAATDIGDLAAIANPPAWLPPDPIEVLVNGISEVWDEVGCKFAYNATPAGPYRVVVLDSPTLGRLETGGAKLAAQAASGATSLLVATTGEALWPTGVQDFDIRCSGSVKHVTDIDSSMVDSFGRLVSNGFGTPDTTFIGTGYTVTGTASEYNVVGPGTGRMQLVSANDQHFAHLDLGSSDQTLYAAFTLGVVPTGAPFEMSLGARLTDTSNYYNLMLQIGTSGAVIIQIFRRVGGTGTAVTGTGAVTLPLTHSAGNEWRMMLDIRGTTLRGRAWKSTQKQPHWQAFGEDNAVPAGTRGALLARRNTGNTNGSTAVDWLDFNVVNPQAFTVDAAAVNGADKILPAGDRVTTNRIAALAY